MFRGSSYERFIAMISPGRTNDDVIVIRGRYAYCRYAHNQSQFPPESYAKSGWPLRRDILLCPRRKPFRNDRYLLGNGLIVTECGNNASRAVIIFKSLQYPICENSPAAVQVSYTWRDNDSFRSVYYEAELILARMLSCSQFERITIALYKKKKLVGKDCVLENNLVRQKWVD